jgi:hypothetical protein
MAKRGIKKLEAAQRQIDCALRMLGKEDSLAVHTLAYAAYCILRDLFGKSETKKVLRKFEKSQKFDKVPNFLKHADHHPESMLSEHSDAHTLITLTLASRLWKEHGQTETPEMLAFSKQPDQFEPGHKASETMKYARQGPIADLKAAQPLLDTLVTAPSTGEAIITKK